MVTTEPHTLYEDMAQTIQDFWENYEGVRPDRVSVFADQQAIVIWLEEVLAPAARQIIGTEPGRLTLQEYGRRILEQAGPQLQHIVAEALGQDVSLAKIHFDIVAGTILGFFLRR